MLRNACRVIVSSATRRGFSSDAEALRRPQWPSMLWDHQPAIIPRSVPHWTSFLALLEKAELSSDAERLLDVVSRCARVSKPSTIEELIRNHWYYLGAHTTIQAINVLLDRAYQLERTDLAVELLRETERRGIRKDRETWEIKIAAAARMDNWTLAQERYDTSRVSEQLVLGQDGWTRLLRICLSQRTPTLIYSAAKAQDVREKAAAGYRNRAVGLARRRGTRYRGRRVVWVSKLSAVLRAKAYVPFDQIAWVTKLLRPDMFPLKTSTLAVSILTLLAQGKADRVDSIVGNWLAELTAQSRTGLPNPFADVSPFLIINHVLMAAGAREKWLPELGRFQSGRSVDDMIGLLFERVDIFMTDYRDLLAAHDDAGPDAGTLLAIMSVIANNGCADRFRRAEAIIDLASRRWGLRQVDHQVTCFALSLAVRDALDCLLDPNQLAQADEARISYVTRRFGNRRPIPRTRPELIWRLTERLESFLADPRHRPFVERYQARPVDTCWPEPGSWADALATEDLARQRYATKMCHQVIAALRRLGLTIRMPRDQPEPQQL